jgi:predicted 3-demethylubiquinone-9 3-methyltransferase (glyoxalase superfamily)
MAILNTNKQKITPFLWFNENAEEAANFYVSVFQNSKIKNISHYGQNAPMPAGTVMIAVFELEGQEFIALNGGPQFTISPAISLVINCETQQEIDHFWEKLSSPASPNQCGWVQDKFGVSWQVVPAILGNLMGSGDSARSSRVMQALWKMNKIIIADLQKAYEQE